MKNSSYLKQKIFLIKSLSDEDFMKHLNSLTQTPEMQVDCDVVGLFEEFSLKNADQFREALGQEGWMPQDRIELLVKKFKDWKSGGGEFSQRIESTHRENLKDLQWKLVGKKVKTGASADSVCVQMQLTAEAEGGRVRRRHLLMDVEAFYDLYEKIEKGVASVREILRA